MRSKEIDQILAEQSAELLEAMKRHDADAPQRLAVWLAESRRHVEHYLLAVALDQELALIDAERKWDITPAAGSGQSNVAPLIEQGAPGVKGAAQRRRPLLSFAAAIVGCIVLLAAFRWLPGLTSGWQEYETALGEQRAVELEDGSIIHLNTGSQVEVRLSEHLREIRLLAGEALFKVHHDPARPFRVFTSDATIQAVGTEFNVRRRPEGTIISVLEGRVRVEGDPGVMAEPGISIPLLSERPSQKHTRPVQLVSLAAGEQARINAVGEIARQQEIDPASVAAWRQRRLIFKGTPLAEVVNEFNRYNRSPRFVLQGSGAVDTTYSGIFDADDPQSLIELLQHEPNLHLERRGESVVIRADGGADAPVIADMPAG